MTAQHPSRSIKGCGLCKSHKRRGVGRAAREPIAVRRAMGKGRRISRGDLGDAG